MKRIVIGSGRWLDRQRASDKRKLVGMIFSLAAQNGYDIVVQGQHWPK